MRKFFNLLIVDDHPMISEAYEAIIKSNLSSYNSCFYKAINCEIAYNQIEEIFNKNQTIDIAILDLSIPVYKIKKILSGLDLGIFIKSKFPKCKIIIITHHKDGFLLNKVFKLLNPQAIINKGDVDNDIFSKVFNKILEGKTFLSETINKSIIEFNDSNFKLDEIDYMILDLIEKGIKTKELPNHIQLSLSAIEKRKAKIKFYIAGKKVRDDDMIKIGDMLKFS